MDYLSCTDSAANIAVSCAEYIVMHLNFLCFCMIFLIQKYYFLHFEKLERYLYLKTLQFNTHYDFYRIYKI